MNLLHDIQTGTAIGFAIASLIYVLRRLGRKSTRGRMLRLLLICLLLTVIGLFYGIAVLIVSKRSYVLAGVMVVFGFMAALWLLRKGAGAENAAEWDARENQNRDYPINSWQDRILLVALGLLVVFTEFLFRIL